MKPFQVAIPTNIEQASSLQTRDDSPFLAGGTDLLAQIKEFTISPDQVVDLKRIEGISGITATAEGVGIGALTTMATVLGNSHVAKDFPALVETLKNTATPQIRNMGSVGGNICQKPRCWYLRHEGYSCAKNGGSGCWAKDGENEFHAIFGNKVCAITQPSNMGPVLVAYGASILIESADGKRQIPAEEFFISPEQDVRREISLEPGEVVTGIWLPASNSTKQWSYVEAREKQTYDWAQASITVLLNRGGRSGDHRVVLGAVAPTPLRRSDLEEIIGNGSLDSERVQKLRDTIGEGANVLSQNGYKVSMLQGLISQATRSLQQVKEG